MSGKQLLGFIQIGPLTRHRIYVLCIIHKTWNHSINIYNKIHMRIYSIYGASLVAQLIKNPPAVQET